MSFEATRVAIESRVQTNWTTTPIKFENVPFKETKDAYVALFILEGEGQQVSLGTPATRRWPGVIIIQVFVPEDSGTKLAKTYADALAAIFDRVQFSSGNSGTISCRIPSVETVGAKDGWHQTNVTVPFKRARQY
jgi:hypothetical protein